MYIKSETQEILVVDVLLNHLHLFLVILSKHIGYSNYHFIFIEFEIFIEVLQVYHGSNVLVVIGSSLLVIFSCAGVCYANRLMQCFTLSLQYGISMARFSLIFRVPYKMACQQVKKNH